MSPKPLAAQMAALNNADETTDLLNSTCPARIQKDRHNVSVDLNRSSVFSRSRRPVRISPVAREEPVIKEDREDSPRRNYSQRHSHNEFYKTKECDAYRRFGHCPYMGNCEYAHGPEEVRELPRRKQFNRNTETSRSRWDPDSSFRRHRATNYGGYNYGGHHHHQRQICKSFERGNCRYGPRCKYIHREQLVNFNPNSTVYVPAEPHPPQTATYYPPPPPPPSHYIPAPAYYVHQYPQPPPPQAPTPDLNQTMPVLGQFYYQPMAPTPSYQPPPNLMTLDIPPPEALAESLFVRPN